MQPMFGRPLKLLLLALVSLGVAGTAPPAPEAQIIDTRMIWGRAPHSSGTDLLRFRDRWYCVFREASQIGTPDGSVRLLSSAEGRVWQSSVLLTLPGSGLSDPKLSAASYGRLLINAEAVSDGGPGPSHRTVVWSSSDAREWEGPVQSGDSGMRLWRPTWHLGRAYSVGFAIPGPGPVRLYSSGEGERYTVQADNLVPPRSNAEGALLFQSDGAALCLLGGDGVKFPAQIGASRAPYRAWTWTVLSHGIDGPSMLRLVDGRIVAAGRIAGDSPHIGLCWLDPGRGTLTEFLRLPSGGDTGSPGLAYYNNMLWVSYHSSHEGRAMIYLAQIKLSPPSDGKKPTNKLSF